MATTDHRPTRVAPLETERAVRTLFDAVYGRGELHRVDGLVAPHYVGRWAGTDGVAVGRAGAKAHATTFRLAFGRAAVEVGAVRVAGDAFEARWTARGRLERRFLGVEPSCVIGTAGEEPHGEPATLAAVTRGAVRGGELVRSTTTWTLEVAGVATGAEADDHVRPPWATLAAPDGVRVVPSLHR